MLSENYDKIFFLECSNKIDFEKFEKDNELLLPDIYKSLLERNCNREFKEYIFFEFEVKWNDQVIKEGLDYYFIARLYDFEFMKTSFSLVEENELDGIEWFPGFKSYKANGYIPFCTVMGGIGITELFLNCNLEENGSVYLIDREIQYGVNDKGYPIKVKVADCIEDLIELGINNIENPKYDAHRWNRIKKS